MLDIRAKASVGWLEMSLENGTTIMSGQAQLEIISPSGEIEFVDLDPQRGVTNIGRHADNDVVIDSASVADFHAMLDHRQWPCHLMLLTDRPGTILDGQPLSPEDPISLRNWATIELDGYTLILLQGDMVEGGGRAAAPAEAAPAPDSRETAQAAALFFDQTDEYIVAEVSEREWTVDVEESAACQLTITNGGRIVASFHVAVEGVDPSWVSISTPQVNLNEYDEAVVTIVITPPRHPTSSAGLHRLAIVVTSPEYPGHFARMSAQLWINPYYSFSVGELSPRRQTVSWRKPSAQASIAVHNKGNGVVPCVLDGADDERACSFEFQAPGHEASLSGQAQFPLAPDESVTIPLSITPLSRKLVAARARLHPFTITASLAEGDQSPIAVGGQLSNKPVFGPLHVFLAMVLLVVLVVYATWPRILSPGLRAKPDIVQAGGDVTLSWRVSPFATDLQIEGIEEPIQRGADQIKINPPVPGATYVLKANNLFSRWLAIVGLSGDTDRTTVLVLPETPVIDMLLVGESEDVKFLDYGKSVTVKWAVSGNVEELVLRAGNHVETIPPEELIGERTIQPEYDTLFVLEARNSSGSDLRSKMVRVFSPSIKTFRVEPSDIVAGETVTITWDVNNTDLVSIAPLAGTFPAGGQVAQQPEETTYYILSFMNGETEVKEMLGVTVHPAPSPTPAPQAPVIEFFSAAPGAIVQGVETEVQLAWSVLGDVTNIQISSLDAYNASGLKAKDIVKVSIKKPTILVLTAFYNDLSASQTVEIGVIEAEPEPTLEPTAEPLLPTITFFKAAGDKGFEDKVIFVKQQADANGPVYVYQIEVGADVLLSWETVDAEFVTLNDESQPAAGEIPWADTSLRVLRLKAWNEYGAVYATIRINITIDPATLIYGVYLPIISCNASGHAR